MKAIHISSITGKNFAIGVAGGNGHFPCRGVEPPTLRSTIEIHTSSLQDVITEKNKIRDEEAARLNREGEQRSMITFII